MQQKGVHILMRAGLTDKPFSPPWPKHGFTFMYVIMFIMMTNPRDLSGFSFPVRPVNSPGRLPNQAMLPNPA